MKLFYAGLGTIQHEFRRSPTSDVRSVAGYEVAMSNTEGSWKEEYRSSCGRRIVRINLPQVSVFLALKTLYTKAIRFNTRGPSLSITTMSTLFLLSFQKKSSLLLLLLW